MSLLELVKQIRQEAVETEQVLDRCNTKGEHLMAVLAEVKAVLKEIDDETTRVAAAYDAILAKLAAGGMTEAEEAEVFDEAKRLSARLKGIAHDPANPVPPVDPTPTPAG